MRKKKTPNKDQASLFDAQAPPVETGRLAPSVQADKPSAPQLSKPDLPYLKGEPEQGKLQSVTRHTYTQTYVDVPCESDGDWLYFEGDAAEAVLSVLVDLSVTYKHKGRQKIPMCGFPTYQTLWIEALKEHGYELDITYREGARGYGGTFAHTTGGFCDQWREKGHKAAGALTQCEYCYHFKYCHLCDKCGNCDRTKRTRLDFLEWQPDDFRGIYETLALAADCKWPQMDLDKRTVIEAGEEAWRRMLPNLSTKTYWAVYRGLVHYWNT